MNDKLFVITTVSNPRRFKSRYNLYKQFEKHMLDSGVELYTVEMAFGNREFAVTDSTNSHHIQLFSKHELWHKENMINIGVSRLPADWKYVAWIDADIMFTKPNWAQETIDLLQHYKVIQMFSHAQDLGPDHQPLRMFNGLVYSWKNKLSYQPGYADWHPGFAWACTREAFDAIGGLLDFAILGSGDRHMANAFIGAVDDNIAPGLAGAYKTALISWADRCNKHIKQDVGYMDGLINHYWHGKKRDRGYTTRWKVLVDNAYNPNTDIKRDWQGLWQLNDDNIGLRDGIRDYFGSRNEDSIDLE